MSSAKWRPFCREEYELIVLVETVLMALKMLNILAVSGVIEHIELDKDLDKGHLLGAKPSPESTLTTLIVSLNWLEQISVKFKSQYTDIYQIHLQIFFFICPEPNWQLFNIGLYNGLVLIRGQVIM